MKTLLPLLLQTILVGGQVKFRFYCPKPQAMEDFDLSRFMGHWNVTMKYNVRSLHSLTCEYWVLDLFRNSEFYISEYGIIKSNKSSRMGDVSHSRYRAVPFQPKDKPVSKTSFQLKMPTEYGELDDFPDYPEPDFTVLDSDYTGYAIIWACRQLDETFHERELYVLTRGEDVSQKITDRYHKKLIDLGMNTRPELLKQAHLETCIFYRSGKYAH